MDDEAGLKIALEEARIGAAAGGVPVRSPLPCAANLTHGLMHYIKDRCCNNHEGRPCHRKGPQSARAERQRYLTRVCKLSGGSGPNVFVLREICI
jgi:hypothetical protein